jgi:hypothetical protein
MYTGMHDKPCSAPAHMHAVRPYMAHSQPRRTEDLPEMHFALLEPETAAARDRKGDPAQKPAGRQMMTESNPANDPVTDEELECIMTNARQGAVLLDELEKALLSGDAERLTVAARAVQRHRRIGNEALLSGDVERLRAVVPEEKRTAPQKSVFPENVQIPVGYGVVEILLEVSRKREMLHDELEEALPSGDMDDLRSAAQDLCNPRDAEQTAAGKTKRSRSR